MALVDAAGIPAYGFTRGPGGEAVEVEEAATGDVRSFLWGPSEADFPVSILDETGTDHLYVAAEGMVLGRLEGGAFVPMAQDGLGSVVLDGMDLLPEPGAFGETPAPASAERRVYALLESLPGTSYHLPRRRLYDSDTGRFASADPVGLLGGDNRFAYLSGNPTAGVDPSGLYWQPYDKSGWDTVTTGLPRGTRDLNPGPLGQCKSAWCEGARPLSAEGGDDKPAEEPEEEVDASRPRSGDPKLVSNGEGHTGTHVASGEAGYLDTSEPGQPGDQDPAKPAGDNPRPGSGRSGEAGSGNGKAEDIFEDDPLGPGGGGGVASAGPGGRRPGPGPGGGSNGQELLGNRSPGGDMPVVVDDLAAAALSPTGVVTVVVVVCASDQGCSSAVSGFFRDAAAGAKDLLARALAASARSEGDAKDKQFERVFHAMGTKDSAGQSASPGVDGGGTAHAGLPKNPDELLEQGYQETSHPEAAAAGHRSFENPETGDTLRFDKGKPGRPGHAGTDHYHRPNPNATGKEDAYLDAEGNPVPDGSGPSHLYP